MPATSTSPIPGNERIHRVHPAATITTIAGTGEPNYSGDNGPAVRARLSEPTDLAVDSDGNLYIADSSNYRIRRVNPRGTITTVAGGGSTDGDNVPAVQARLSYPSACGVRRHWQPLHCRYLQRPHSPRGFDRNHHHRGGFR